MHHKQKRAPMACAGFAALVAILFPAPSASAWYAYGTPYEAWQAGRPMMMAALHNSVPEDALPARIARFRAAGLNTIVWWKPANALHIFEAARADGLSWACGSVGGRAAVASAMRVPGNAFIMVKDEPGEKELPAIVELSSWIRQTYPGTPVFTNLSIAEVDHDTYVEACAPDIFAFDHYPLQRNGQTQDHYLYNVAWARRTAMRHHLPFWMTLQAWGREEEKPSYAYRVPDEADLRFLVFSFLAHGGTGMMFFHYYGHPGSMIEDTGVNREASGPTSAHRYEHTVASRAWYALRDVAPEIRNLAGALLNLRPRGDVTYAGDGRLWDHGPPTYSQHNPKQPLRCTRFAGHGPLQDLAVVDGTDMGLLIGFFDDEQGQEYFMVVNLAHGAGQSKMDALGTVSLRFDATVEQIERLNRLTGRVETLATRARADGDGRELVIQLEGGTGDLFKWHNGQPWHSRGGLGN